MSADFDELLNALREDRLDDAGRARLAALLEDPELRRRYVDALLLVSLLRRVDVAALAGPRRKRRTPLRWAAAAAAALIAAAALLVPDRPVAALTAASDARWDGAPRQAGDRLRTGRLKLAGGLVQITFRSGAIALVQAPADLELQAPDRAFLHSGRVVVRVPQGSGGFRLETSTARLLDLGTEFGVSVQPDGPSVLQVYEGQVAATPRRGPGEERRLESGQAIGIGERFRDERFEPDRFVRALPFREDPAGRGPFPYNTSTTEEIRVVRAPAAVRIDGDLSEWDRSGRIRVACVAPWGDHHYLDAAMMYDDRFLYVGAHVGDPFPMRSQVSPHEKRELYGMGGGVALRISTDRKAGWPLSAESPYVRVGKPLRPQDVNDKLTFLMLWHYEPENLACLQVKHGMDLHDMAVNPPGYQGKFSKDADGKGYTVEYALPWGLLNAAEDPPRAGDVLAAMWLAHWSDEKGRTWKGHLVDVQKPGETGWNHDRAALWGRAVYR